MKNTYYVLSSEYVGPNLSDRCNSHTVHITTEPGRTNMSNEVRVDGWLGTSNDWAAYAHGEYDSIESARAAVIEMLGENHRLIDNDEYDESVVETYAASKYVEWDADNSITWCYESRREITADTTDERIAEIVAECEEYANDEGNTLDTDAVEEMLTEHRDELRAEANESDDE